MWELRKTKFCEGGLKVPLTHSQYLSFQKVETYNMQKQATEWDLRSISIFNRRSKNQFTK